MWFRTITDSEVVPDKYLWSLCLTAAQINTNIFLSIYNRTAEYAISMDPNLTLISFTTSVMYVLIELYCLDNIKTILENPMYVVQSDGFVKFEHTEVLEKIYQSLEYTKNAGVVKYVISRHPPKRETLLFMHYLNHKTING